MHESRTAVRKIARFVGTIGLAILFAVGALLGGMYYLNWSAEREVKAFCDDVAIGSDISLTLDKASVKHIFHSDSAPYNFYFFSTGFDKAVCEVSVDANRQVISRTSVMEYD